VQLVLHAVPEQTYPPAHDSVDAFTQVPVPHVPAGTNLSPAQEAEHGLSQQNPSAEQVVPDTQPPATALQVCPFLLLQAPVASQVPAHRWLGSSAFVTVMQLCEVVSHVMHVPVQSVLLQQAVSGMHVVVDPTVHDFVEPVQA